MDASALVPTSALTRRQAIRLLGVAGLFLATGPGCSNASPAPATPEFSPDEVRALNALADAVIPPDADPGGAALGAVAYIERLVTAFDGASVTIFADGPFSGRMPYPASNGQPSSTFPIDDFANWLELDRVNAVAWRLNVLGSSAVSGGAPNETLLGTVVGIRAQIHQGLATAIAQNATPLDQLSPSDLAAAFNDLDADFQSLLIDLVTEAAFAAPEYGGNPGGAGWTLCHFEGDSLPLGYSQWNGTTYVERADSPLSTPNPGADPAPLTSDVTNLLDLVAGFLGGTVTT
ncbi:MAG: hypothetical protein ACLQBL_22875 [Polyangiaceae bacterium]